MVCLHLRQIDKSPWVIERNSEGGKEGGRVAAVSAAAGGASSASFRTRVEGTHGTPATTRTVHWYSSVSVPYMGNWAWKPKARMVYTAPSSFPFETLTHVCSAEEGSCCTSISPASSLGVHLLRPLFVRSDAASSSSSSCLGHQSLSSPPSLLSKDFF